MNTHQYYLNKIKNHVKISMIRILSISISSPNVKFYYIRPITQTKFLRRGIYTS